MLSRFLHMLAFLLLNLLNLTAGEGSKPIFDREEIKRGIGETEEVEEHRSVVTVNVENSETKLKTLKRHSASSSPTRTRNYSPRRSWSRHRREKDHSRERKNGERSYRDHREWPRDHSRDRSQTDRSRERDTPREQRVPREHYIQPIPIPLCYGNFPPRPFMGPWGPIRGPLAGNIHPRMMGPFGAFPSPSIGISPPMYRFHRPVNPRT